ncbi:Mu transposase domain-containing protein [Streptomyces sp. NPDC002206]
MALRPPPLPPTPYLVAERNLRPVDKDCLVACGGNLYSVPARKVRPRQLVEIRATKSQVMLHSTVAGPAARRCWPPILGRSAAGSASSNKPTERRLS